MSMKKEILLAYQRCWLRLNTLLRLASSLDLRPSEDDLLVGSAQQRWNQLKSLYPADQQEALR